MPLVVLQAGLLDSKVDLTDGVSEIVDDHIDVSFRVSEFAPKGLNLFLIQLLSQVVFLTLPANTRKVLRDQFGRNSVEAFWEP